MLVILGGLPGTGKSTIGKKLSETLNAVYLRIDSIEQAIRDARDVKKEEYDMGPEGYTAAFAIARDNLSLGFTVVADSVNPIALSRTSWRDVAIQLNTPFVEIEFICSNEVEHRQRIETRTSTIPRLQLPTWEEVINRDYEPWESTDLIIDTATDSVANALRKIISTLKSETL